MSDKAKAEPLKQPVILEVPQHQDILDIREALVWLARQPWELPDLESWEQLVERMRKRDDYKPLKAKGGAL